MIPNFEHDCTVDALVAVVAGKADVYRHCAGVGYIVRFSSDGPDYTSSVMWTVADAFRVAMQA